MRDRVFTIDTTAVCVKESQVYPNLPPPRMQPTTAAAQ